MTLANVKMIVMDMDDTLLSHDLTISPENQVAIKNAQQAGIVIVLASGRPTPAMWSYAEQLGLNEGGFLVSYNGAFVHDCQTKTVMFETCLTKQEHDLLVHTAREQDCTLHTYVDGDIITHRANPHTDFEAELTGMPVKIVPSMTDYVTESVPKVLLTGEPEKVKQLKQTLMLSLGDRFMISISKPVFLEFTNQAVDKSAGIDVICNHLRINKHQVMAIGDSYNDLTMIRDCGIGVAMGNAPADIQSIADVVTLSCTDNGVAHMINQVLSAQPSLEHHFS